MRLRRRQFLWSTAVLAGAGALVGAGIAGPSAWQQGRVPRLAVLTLATVPRVPFVSRLFAFDPHVAAFLQGLRDLGYVDGETMAIEVRGAGGAEALLPDLAAELVRLDPDVLVVTGTMEARAAMTASSTLPIVFTTSADPIESGLVASLSHPGGNVTGLSLIAPELNGKRLELIQAVVPGLVRVAILAYAASLTLDISWHETQAAAARLGLQPQLIPVESADDVDNAFGRIATNGAQALITHPDQFLVRHHDRIIGHATRMRLPSMHQDRQYVAAGGLMAYGPSFIDNWRRTAAYVGKILKGAKPADLPVERPTRFDLTINLTTAQALGLTIPRTMVSQATEIIR